MKIKGITDVFFDLDHTLWDFDKNSALAFNKIFKINKLEINDEEFLKHYKPINDKYWKLYREEKVDKNTLRFGRLNDAFLEMNLKVEATLINKLSDDYITNLSTFNYLIENTIEILDYLKPNYKLHIITNGFDEVQNKKMKKSKIETYFKTITNSEKAGVKKPNPIIFQYAIKKANTNVKTSVMIGDSYEADILGALKMGMDVVFFDENNSVLGESLKKINNLIELKRYL